MILASMLCCCVLILATLSNCVNANSALYPPFIKASRYVRYGDISLGGLFPISTYDSDSHCGKDLMAPFLVTRMVEAMVYAVDVVNARDDLLSGIRLGFTILDTCAKPSTALAQMLHFRLPRWAADLPTSEHQQCSSSSSNSSHLAGDQGVVVGLIGALLSSCSLPVARLAASYKLPQISYGSTSDSLSDKDSYPYFLRLAPPDRFQAKAIVSLINYFEWTYVAFLHSADDYGRNGFELFKTHVDNTNICIGYSAAIDSEYSEAYFDDIVDNLLANENLRVVVLFTAVYSVKPLSAALARARSDRKLIWIAGDMFATPLEILNGDFTFLSMFTMHLHAKHYGDFDKYFRFLNPVNYTRNPWFKRYWEQMYECSWSNMSSQNACDPISGKEDKSDSKGLIAGSVIDAVTIFAKALTTIIKNRCPNATAGNILDCLDGDTILSYRFCYVP